jgi:hypothetical protein
MLGPSYHCLYEGEAIQLDPSVAALWIECLANQFRQKHKEWCDIQMVQNLTLLGKWVI